MNHTPEPWRVESTTVWNKDFRILQTDHCGSNKGDIKQANAKRIVTCVNACAGIENPEALPDLLKAVSGMLKRFNQHDWECVIGGYITDCERALAKLEGNQ